MRLARTRFRRPLATLLAALVVAACPLVLGGRSATAVPVREGGLSDDAVGALVRNQVARSGLPGVAVVVTKGRQVVYADGAGRANDGRPVTGDTRMRVASVSKSFTAYAVMVLARRGVLDLDAPVARVLAEFR